MPHYYDESPECPFCGSSADVEFVNPNEFWCNACDDGWEDDPVGSEWDEDRIRDGDDIDFAEPGGRSALRAETPDNPRSFPCPSCGAENVLTPADVAKGYQCNRCADAAEGYGY
jgi:ribosomal protein L37AE/L43A